jgi:hypothetical protein
MAVIGARLAAYLGLERQMLALDAAGDPIADLLRDAMDPLWYALSDEEHAELDSRVVVDESGAPLTAPAGDDLFTKPVDMKPLVARANPLSAKDWECAA